MSIIRDEYWWNNRSKKLVEDMTKNRLWYEKGLKQIAAGEPMRIEDKDVIEFVEDWTCESGEDRFVSWNQYDKWVQVRMEEVKKKQYGKWRNGEQIEIGF